MPWLEMDKQMIVCNQPPCLINRFSISVFFLAVIISLSGTVRAAEKQSLTKNVEVIGTATIYKDNVAGARDQAISRSLVSAVDIVAVDLLPLEYLVRKFETLNEIIYIHSGKFVQSYKVLTEARIGNRYRVIVQVTVLVNKLEEQLSIAGIMPREKTLPSILFCIAEQNLEDLSPQYWWGENFTFFKSICEDAMAATMKKKGFSVVSHGKMFSPMDIEAEDYKSGLNTPDLTNEEAVNLGSLFQADVVIVGKSIAQKAPNIMGANIRSFKGRVIVRALRTDTGEEIAATAQTAVTANIDENVGSHDALSRAGSLAGEKLAAQIISSWQKRMKEATTIEIIVEGTRYLSNFVTFRRKINGITGVIGVQTKEMKFDEAILAVDFQGNAKGLADALMLKTYDTFGINIYEVSQNRLRIELIPGPASSNS